MTTAGLARPLSVGICAPYDLSRDGGVNSHIRAQARALRRLGHDVAVFGTASGPLADGEMSIGRCISLVIGGTDTALGFDPRARRRVVELYRARQFDVVHVHEPLMPLAPWFAVRHATVPVVATFHVHREHGHRWYGPYRRVLSPVMRRIDVRIAVSDAAKRTVAHHFPGDYAIVPNGIDVDRFRQPAARPPGMREEGRYVLFVGRLEPRKGVDCLIRAMAIVQQRVRAARLVVVGDGPDRAAIETAARDAGVRVWFAGRVPEELLPAYYRAADVVCSPALGDESFGIVLLEAMAAGRPIVATRIEGYAELLAGTDCGRLVDIGEPAPLADEIAALLGDPELCRALGARAAAFASRYDWSAIARRLESIYSSVTTGDPLIRALA
jgi:phosphatidyl-myo-inositol alpha-mannosyltransferase